MKKMQNALDFNQKAAWHMMDDLLMLLWTSTLVWIHVQMKTLRRW